ncbi:MAG: MBL fold metallo-hydrolase [Tepidibacter sp.]|jgi:alkyl sulfatase BDS1-like metallo-beta-lactamase superfamily hydrolase|uniref:alkyl/aryl-sulfatase n=1 Tax=Tepidibacter sp. TaxID=2529387 RepID=UPI0025F9A9A4|nr:alkyl sulfatase dimerization domain-containing protein [Tepidibacter sp.]MCT4508555.1 MBL fold metallo-hydrolase [Tepidibacter sp.]
MDSKNNTNARRKKATYKTKLINKEVYINIDWNKLKIEKSLAKKNVVVDVELPVIKKEDSLIPVWDLRRYAFLLEDKIPYTVNPKLWEQGKLNLNSGIFRITDRIYQVRGFDLANISLIRGNTGWIVIDCLTSKETAEAAIKLVNEHFGEIPISAVIFSHSHVDHYGGILGVLNSKTTENIKVYAPRGFMDAVIEENVNAGVAMTRRGLYMYGELLPRDKKGQIDCGIGKYVSGGTVTLTNNVNEISPIGNEEYIEKVIDGVTMQFLLTEDTEAPSEMDMYIPSEKSLCIAENCSATLHNIYTLRGAEVRDPVAWAGDIQKAINLWGDDLTSVFGVHTWPRFGNKYCIEYMEKQRDLYQYINDQILRLINKGYTIDDVGRMVKFPQSLSDEWYDSSFYGTVVHNSKAVYQKYIGWYNGNPVDLNKLFPEESAKKYVEYMGGENSVLKKAKKSFEYGEYQWVAEVTKQVIYANPDNRDAKLLCADALEQLGYIAESGPWRNEYLMGAQELRFGIIPIKRSVITDEVLDAIPLENVLYLMSIRIDGLKAGDFDYKINFIIPDREEVASTQVKRGIFRYLDNELAKDAAVTVTMSKETLYELATTNNKPDSSSIKVEGDICKWQLFLWTQDRIDSNFNIMTPVTKK